ncbi:MAG: YraN family protein [Cytophagaceae bacterium]|jgi:putative endonuclease|nr:YraN family protein [Cytophagaceae bacterium]
MHSKQTDYKAKKATRLLGEAMEQKACQYLQSRGFVLLKKNYRYRRGEIDAIMQHENVLVFVEVKYRRNNRFGFPECSVTEKKIVMIQTTAEQYMLETAWQGRIRFDIVSICGEQLIHLEDAF